MKRICKECGKEFEAKSSRKLFCDDDHYRKCVICGNMFLVPKNKLSSPIKTCSENCRRMSISNTEKQNQYEYDLICKICGKSFKSKHKYPCICDDIHYKKCEYCGKLFKANKQQLVSGTKTCSNECRYLLSNKTLISNYGVSNPGKSSHIRDKMKQTCIAKYGVDNPMKCQQFKYKSIETCLSKYGETRFSKTDEFIRKTKSTNQRRYGVDWESQTDNHKNAVKQTCLQKYGVDNPGKVGKYIVDKMSNPAQLSNLLEFHDDPARFIGDNFDHKPTLAEVANLCGVIDSSIGDILLRTGNQHLCKHSYSKMEDEVYQFLLSILPTSVTVIRNTKQIITPYEFDIYLPEYSLAIECNPTITHNSSIGLFDEVKSYNYHKMKTDLAQTKDIFLFHIFGYEWSHCKDICKSMLCNLLKCNSTSIYARNTVVKEVSANDAYQFLNTNHRQGGVHSKIRLGLYYENSLISLMTFNKIRNTIGTSKSDLSDCWELVRFCNKLNTSVVGGASKLFKYFINNYDPVRIRSFSDRAHTKGNLYLKLGFNKIHQNDPGYMWVNLKTDKAYSRNNAQKQNIKQFLHDDSIDLSKTEPQIMIEHGFVQVFDSGTILWEWQNR